MLPPLAQQQVKLQKPFHMRFMAAYKRGSKNAQLVKPPLGSAAA